MGQRGAGRFSYLDVPQPGAAANTNFNRSVTPTEMADAASRRFDILDINHDGFLTLAELPDVRPGPRRGRKP